MNKRMNRLFVVVLLLIFGFVLFLYGVSRRFEVVILKNFLGFLFEGV